jgi:hypothetical protein
MSVLDAQYGRNADVFLVSAPKPNSLSEGGTMKILIYCSVFVLLALISFPITADAFSNGHHHSEMMQNQQTPPHGTNQHGTIQTQTDPSNPNMSAHAVPEPPVLLLMSIVWGLLALYSLIKRFRGQRASREKAL